MTDPTLFYLKSLIRKLTDCRRLKGCMELEHGGFISGEEVGALMRAVEKLSETPVDRVIEESRIG